MVPIHFLEVVMQSSSLKKVFLEILHNSQENTCTTNSGIGFFFCEFCEISKNNFFHKAPLVTDSDFCNCIH